MKISSLTSPLYEAAITPTEYGYWITQNGEYIPVPIYMHANVLSNWRLENNVQPDGTLTGYDQAYNWGWIRVVGGGHMEKEISSKYSEPSVRPRALKALFDLIRTVGPGTEKFWFEIKNQQENYDRFDPSRSHALHCR